MNFSETKKDWIIAFLATNVIVLTVAAQIVLNYAKKMQEVGKSIGRIAAYQNALIQKHVVPMDLDEFDQLVIDDMTKELYDRLRTIGYKPKDLSKENE